MMLAARWVVACKKPLDNSDGMDGASLRTSSFGCQKYHEDMYAMSLGR
jgi:hypothetical protein